MKRRLDDEASLFRESVRDVKRLPASERHAERRKPPPRARLPGHDKPESDTGAGGKRLEPGDSLQFVRSGVSRALLRELRRGRLRPQAVLDLHGLSVARAERALQDFLGEALARGLGCIRIVHGKGLHSGAEGPVLKTLVDATLRRTSGVRAFASARPAHGGAGAVNVLLEG